MSKRKFAIIIILIFAIGIISSSIVMAKYFSDKEKETLYVAESFYFESDLLTSDATTKTYTYQKGKDNIQIVLKNNIDDFRFSDVDIDYSVKITDLNGTEVKSPIQGTLSKGSINEQTISFNNLATGSYTITATAIAPYEKTIKANFIIEAKNTDISYRVTDVTNSAVAQLTITTNDYNGNVKITWPQGVAPDSTNSIFSDVNTGYNSSNKTIEVSSKSETIIQFFKEDASQQYKTEDFQVVIQTN